MNSLGTRLSIHPTLLHWAHLRHSSWKSLFRTATWLVHIFSPHALHRGEHCLHRGDPSSSTRNGLPGSTGPPHWPQQKQPVWKPWDSNMTTTSSCLNDFPHTAQVCGGASLVAFSSSSPAWHFSSSSRLELRFFLAFNADSSPLVEVLSLLLFPNSRVSLYLPIGGLPSVAKARGALKHRTWVKELDKGPSSQKLRLLNGSLPRECPTVCNFSLMCDIVVRWLLSNS